MLASQVDQVLNFQEPNLSFTVVLHVHLAPKLFITNTQGLAHDERSPVHDIAIVGGGMVGMALACSLGK